MKKRVMLILSCLFVCMGLIVAQTTRTTGTVLDSNGEPVISASVVVKGTTIGTVTDLDGKFSIGVPEGNNTLVFTLMGMVSVETKASQDMRIVMENDDRMLDEVVVVAYGTTSRKNVISSSTKVSDKELGRLSVASVDMALQGAAPGVVISANSGAPGAGNTVRLRGATSVSGSNNPLYIVDGTPIFTGSTVSNIYGGQGTNALTNLSVSDIESVTVLKDASATAIYGARASNGVILITTKRGAIGKPKIELNMSYGSQNPIKFYEMMNLGEYLKYADLALANSPQYGVGGSGWTSYMSHNLGYATSRTEDPNSPQMQEIYNMTSTPYADEIKNKNAVLKQVDLSVSGGNDNTKYYVGGSFIDQEGVVKGQNYRRSSMRLNIDQKLYQWLSFAAGFSVADENIERSRGDNNIYAPTTTSALEIPGRPLYNEDGTFNKDFSFSNPLENAIGSIVTNKSQRYLGNMGFTATIPQIEGLKLNAKASLDRMNVAERIYDPKSTKIGAGDNGYALYANNYYNRYVYTLTANYSRTFFDKLNVSALAGFEHLTSTNTMSNIESVNFPSNKLTWPVSGATPQTAEVWQTGNKLASYFSRISSALDDKYLAEFSIRADASSKFGKNNRVGYFPSVSLGWKLHNESWFNLEKINELKLKASYGLTGNESGIGNFASRSLAGVTNYGENPGLSITQLGDDNLSWEKTYQFNVGIDLGLLNDRLRFSYEYFNKLTKDMLLATPLPGSTGFMSRISNIGKMENRGHEVSLHGVIIDNSELKWDASFSIATLANKVKMLYADLDGKITPIDAGFVSRVDVGQAIGAFYLYKFTGLDKNGDATYDMGKDGILNDDDKYYAGKPLPDYTGSFTSSLSYKGFDLSIFFQFSQGYEVYNNSKSFAGAAGAYNFNKFKDQLGYWTPDNKNTDIPRPMYGHTQGMNNLDSDRLLEDGSYVRLKNVTFGYNIPQHLTKNMKVRLYFTADNIHTWTDYTGLDPEVNFSGNTVITQGTDFFTQGLNRTYKFGVNIVF